MRVTSDVPSPAAAARRAQIVSAAIDTIAEYGYMGSSFAKIAKTAGISSTRLISYHFDNKNDLMLAVIDHIITAAEEYMNPRIMAESDYWARISTYIRSNMEYLVEHTVQLRALLEINYNAQTPDGEPLLTTAYADPAVETLEQVLRAGQAAGEFADFDVHVMAVTLRAAIDTAGIRYANGLEPDPAAYTHRLVELFGRSMLRRDDPRNGEPFNPEARQ
ncbi:TetR/AcrR family transcriptional regulator [Nocardia sp. NPDC020380]|uniref:TetR/AcrR family transcriptional regulator n=1 Tax=Nocardia sp. NPDC020380 TaxID=3364309 RepID=UPI003790D92D